MEAHRDKRVKAGNVDAIKSKSIKLKLKKNKWKKKPKPTATTRPSSTTEDNSKATDPLKPNIVTKNNNNEDIKKLPKEDTNKTKNATKSTTNIEDSNKFDIGELFQKNKQNKEVKATTVGKGPKEPQSRKPFGEDLPLTRTKVDGVKVYSYVDLKLGSSGGTPLCPFDCTCCF